MGKIVKGIGKIAKFAAPIVGMIPGVGTLPAAILGGAGGLASGEGLGGALKGALGGAAGGLGGKFLGGTGGGILGKAKALITKNPLKALELGTAGYSAFTGAKQQAKANQAMQQALGRIGNVGNLQAPDLSSTFADYGNPYAQPPPGGNPALAAAKRSLQQRAY